MAPARITVKPRRRKIGVYQQLGAPTRVINRPLSEGRHCAVPCPCFASMLRKLMSVLPAAALALMSLATLAAVKLTPGQPGEPVAALFRPDVSADDAFRRVVAAGGYVLRAGGLPSLIIARSSDPEFITALYRMGAVLVADANGARGCPEPTLGDSR